MSKATADTMFQVNDMVMHGSTGVCKVLDIRKEKFSGKERLYYILKPENDEGAMIYCPVDSDKVKMRKLLSREEIFALIKNMPDMDMEWIKNDQQRKETYTRILKQGSHQDLVRLLKVLYFNRQEKLGSGKKFHVMDEKIMKEAEKILHGELAYVLNIEVNEVAPFIEEELQKIGL